MSQRQNKIIPKTVRVANAKKSDEEEYSDEEFSAESVSSGEESGPEELPVEKEKKPDKCVKKVTIIKYYKDSM